MKKKKSVKKKKQAITKKRQPVKKQITKPLILKLIYILMFIFTAFLLISGISLISNANLVTEQLTQIALEEGMPEIIELISPQTFITAGIILIIISVIMFILAFYLRKTKKWAKITTIILSIFVLIISLLSLTQGNTSLFNILSLIISALIASYLLFNRQVKIAFT